MAAMTTPIRVVLCGRRTEIGKVVASLLRPEYETIHFLQTEEAAKAELPHILAGTAPPSSSHANDVGTHDYSVLPRAVILGRAFDIADVEDIQKVCAGIAKEPVAWIVADPAQMPAGPPGPPGPNYAQEVTATVKKVLGAWVAEGGKQDGSIFY